MKLIAGFSLVLAVCLFHVRAEAASVKISLVSIAPRASIIDPASRDFYTLQGTSALLVERSDRWPVFYAYLPSSRKQLAEIFRFPLRGLRKVVDKDNLEKRIDGRFQAFNIVAFGNLYRGYDLKNLLKISELNVDAKIAEQIADELEKRSSQDEPASEYSLFVHNSSAALGELLFSFLGKQATDELNRYGLAGDPEHLTGRVILKSAVRQALNTYQPLYLSRQKPSAAYGYGDLLRSTKQEFRTEQDLIAFMDQVHANVKALAQQNPQWYQGLFERVRDRMSDKELFDTDLLTSKSLYTAVRLKAALDRVKFLKSDKNETP